MLETWKADKIITHKDTQGTTSIICNRYALEECSGLPIVGVSFYL